MYAGGGREDGELFPAAVRETDRSFAVLLAIGKGACNRPCMAPELLCSECCVAYSSAEMTIVPSFDASGRWGGAFRCTRDRHKAFREAKAVLEARGGETPLVEDFFDTVERWGVPRVALWPFTVGKPLGASALLTLDLLERNVVRLSAAEIPSVPHQAPVWLAIDAVLAVLIAPRGHAIEVALFPALRANEARAVILPFAIKCAVASIREGDRLDIARWEELLSHADIDPISDPAPTAPPSANEIAHWRAVVFGEDQADED